MADFDRSCSPLRLIECKREGLRTLATEDMPLVPKKNGMPTLWDVSEITMKYLKIFLESLVGC